MTDSHPWEQQSPEDKQRTINELREHIARTGHPAPNAPASPAALAQLCDRRFQLRAHNRAIDEALVWLSNTPGARLMVFTPPQVGKSTLCSRWLPAWWFTQHPTDAVAIASYAASLATRHGAATRDIVEAYGQPYGLRLGRTANRNTWELTSGGTLDAVGLTGGLTGKPVNLGIIDDPFKNRAEADSPIVRENVWDWFSSTFTSRRQPGMRMLLVMTRWHQDDLAGRLLRQQGREEDGGRWRVLHLPAIAVAEDRQRGFYADPLGREPGEPLSHPKYPDGDTVGLAEHWAEARADSIARDFNALYQGVPFDVEGALLDDNDLLGATIDSPGPALRVAVAVDPSGGGRDEAGIVAGQLGTDGKVTITHDRTERMAASAWAEKACLLAVEVDADRIIVEKNYGGDIALDLIRLTWERLQQREKVPADRLCPMIREVVARRSKVLRAEPIAAAIKSGRVKLVRDGLDKVRIEFTQWEPGSTWSPGALDAAVHLATELMQRPPRSAGTASRRDRRDVREGQVRRLRREA